jgi:predicted ATPase
MKAKLIGRTLAHYRVQRKLGSGAMGEVYLAEDPVLGRSVALKVLPSETSVTPDRMRRFIEEAKAASALNHPNIATVHELREADGVHFIVMEYVEGGTLKAKVARGPLNSSEIIKLATQIAQALDAAHSIGIIHRDVKSSNIMITPRGHAKVLDFGLAKRTTFHEPLTHDLTRDATEPSVVMGTVPYMSPEQALGKVLDQRSDLFSFGVVLYEMATGRLPFSGSTAPEMIDNIIHGDPQPVTSINPQIPLGLARLISRCLEKRAEYRVQTAAELASELRKSENDIPAFGRGDTFRSNLPQQLTRFIGRQREIAEIRDLLTHTRLLTLSGPGGIGKTRLALQVAGDSLLEYRDGVWFVEFASLADTDLVPHTVASTLGVHEEAGRSITDTVVDFLKSTHVLLVLDNCEHLISACAQLTDKLLRSSKSLRVLVTSQEPLAIAGEAVFRVSSLGLPDPQGQPDPESLSKHEAVELFLDRARSVKSTFAIGSSNALALAKLCVQLDGIPLAIELAASRASVLSVEQIAARISDRLTLLTGGSRTALPRHQTLLAAIDWSYNLLSESEKILFRRLSVFSGGWTLEAAETVCAGDGVDTGHVLGLLAGLVDKSLVLAEEREGQQRYRFMVTLLEYALKRLMQTEEGETISRGHARFFVALAVAGEPKLMSTEQKVWLEGLNAEYDNIRAVLNWTSKKNAEMGLRLAGALGQFWYLRGYWDEGRRWLAEMLGASGALAHPAQRVRALNAAAWIALNQGEYVSARSFSEEALSLSRESGDKRETGFALNCLAILTAEQGEFAVARSLLEESLTIRRELGDKSMIASTLQNVGILAFRQGEFASARSLFEESLGISREVGYKHGIATALVNCGEVARRMGDHAAAQALLDEGLALAKDMGDKIVIPIALNALGALAGRQGDYAAARALHTKGLEVSRELGDKRLIAENLQSLGIVAEKYPAARSLFEKSLAIRRELGDRAEIAIALNHLGSVIARQGDYATARSLHEEGLAICQQLGVKDGIAQSLKGLADVAHLGGDYALAVSLYRQSLAMWLELGEKPEFLHPLEHVAGVLMARGQHERAVRLWGAAQGLRNTISVPRPPYETDRYERQISAARVVLGEEGFAVFWAQGQAMGTDQAIEYALQDEET